jgi:hypothetical protein
MRKILPLLVVGILVLSGLGAVASTESEKENFELETINFSIPTIKEKNDFVSVDLLEKSFDLWESNKPMLPAVTKVYTYPLGTKIDSIDVTFSNVIEREVTKPIKVSPEPIAKTDVYSSNINTIKKTVDYTDIDIYPESRFSYKTAGGLKGEERVTYLSVNLYPVQYSPNDNKIFYSQEATIDVKYTLPAKPLVFGDAYDLLIIAPEDFSSALQPLITHKEGLGIATKLTTLEEIPSGVGVDEQEDIKYYIKDAITNWGITYLILVGAGVDGAEIFPVRYVWIPSLPYEENFPSDLYYADVFDDEGNFSTWDNDGDGRFGEYSADVPAMDIIPDVHLGKWPANNAAEVTAVVDKIIHYKAHNKITNKIMQVGGDTFPGDAEGINEGEFANEDVLDHLPGYVPTRLWGSNGQLTKHNWANAWEDIPDFVDTSGHGSTRSWATHPPEDDSIWIPVKTFLPYSPYSGWTNDDFDTFNVKNYYKLPVVFYNACSNNKYSKSDKCLSWATVRYPEGGGIAAFGASGIGYGAQGSQETARLMGWMEVHILEEIFLNKILGLAWTICITDYYNTFSPLNSGDYKTLTEISMFGDPTLAIEDGDDPKVRSVNIPQFNFYERFAELFPRLVFILEKIFE